MSGGLSGRYFLVNLVLTQYTTNRCWIPDSIIMKMITMAMMIMMIMIMKIMMMPVFISSDLLSLTDDSVADGTTDKA